MRKILMTGLSPIGGGREKETLNVLIRNSKAVVDVVKKFEEMIIALFSKRDIKKAEALGRAITDLESKADEGRRKFARSLSGGAFLPAFRGDLARLAERIDGVADTAEEVTRGILLRKKFLDALLKAERKRKKAEGIRKGLVRMGRLATQAAEALESSIKALASNVDLANAKVAEIEKIEHESDMVEQSLLAEVYEYEKLLDPVSVFQLNNIIRGIGDISDRAEDAGDVISIVSYSIKA